MTTPKKKPDMQPRELRDSSGWYVFVQWHYLPSEQVGGFPSEAEAQQWIDQSSAAWVKNRLEEQADFRMNGH